MKRIALFLAAVPLLALTACGGSPASHTPAKPKISAASACKGFETWFLAHGMSHSAKGISELVVAVHEAPSGNLYRDMSTLEANVKTAAATKGSLGTAEFGMVTVDAQQVESDCQNVNPGS